MTGVSTPYLYRSLTSTLGDKTSPLLRYMRETFPKTLPVRREFKAASGEIVVPSMGSTASTVGTAFDVVVQYMLDPDRPPFEAVGFFTGDMATAVLEVAMTARNAVTTDADGSDEVFLRACWALALCTQVYRAGGIYPGSTLDRLIDSGRFDADALITLAPTEPDIAELNAVCMLAQERLFPRLDFMEGPVHLGPQFAGSEHCPADADLVVNRCLVELKCALGDKVDAPGGRVDYPAAKTIHQMLGYVLFDFDDEYELNSVALYSARFGTFVQWPLQDFLDRTAGRPVVLSEERAAVRALVTS